MADVGSEFIGWWVGISGMVAGGLGLYKAKKLDELPEKMARDYVLKTEVHIIKQDLRDDMKNMENKILAAFDRVHERLDKQH